MRISDWSSDVCSSDLGELTEAARLLDRSHEMTGVVMEETGANQSNRLRVVVDANLCTPPKDAYLGAIRMTDQQGRWKKAILKVSDLTSSGRTIVHLTFGGALPVRSEEHTYDPPPLMRHSYAVISV